MRSRLAVATALVLLVLAACSISEKEIESEINRRGGEILLASRERPLNLGLGLEAAQMVGMSGIQLIYTPPVGTQPCTEYCWGQVVRKFLDHDVVMKPSLLDPFFAGEDGKLTESGFVVDASECDRTYKGNTFMDDPAFPIATFESNKINSRARLFVAEFETCVRCNNPKGPWLSCVKWYYVRLRTSKGSAVYIVKGSVASSPTSDFTKALDKWKSP